MTPREKIAVRCAASGLTFAAIACGRSTPSSVTTPTYAEDVAPILTKNCVGCHREGGVAPFSLTTYEQARTNAAAIKSATQKRQMPPFNLDNSGLCQTYSDARWLDDTSIATISSWVDGNTPLGDTKRAPPVAPPPPGLDRVAQTLDMGTAYTPSGSGVDDYRCFVLDPALAEDRFITGFEVHPGEARMVHHLTLFALDSADAEREAARLDEAEPGPGYTCFGDTRVESRWLVGAGPGQNVYELPKGTGLEMRAGRKTVLQMHYSRTQGTFPDRTTIDLRLEPRVESAAFIQNAASYDLRLPPRAHEVSSSAKLKVPEAATLWGLWPHMHRMGKKLNLSLMHDGREQCLAQVNDWDFHWQGFASYAKPIALAAGDQVRVTCTYDTSSRDQPTVWGSGTDDEMCVAFLYLTARRGGRSTGETGD